MRSRSTYILLALVLCVILARDLAGQRVVSACFTLHAQEEQWGPLPDSVRILVHRGGIPFDLRRPPAMEPDENGWALALGEFVSSSRLFVLLPRESGWLHVVFGPRDEVMEGEAWDGEGDRPTPDDHWSVEARPVECPGGSGGSG